MRQRETEHEQGRGRERGRHRIQSRLRAPSCQHRAPRGARTHEAVRSRAKVRRFTTEPSRRSHSVCPLPPKCRQQWKETEKMAGGKQDPLPVPQVLHVHRLRHTVGVGGAGLTAGLLCIPFQGPLSTSYFPLQFSCLRWYLAEPKETTRGVETQNLSLHRCAGFSFVASCLCGGLCSPARSGARSPGTCDK